jgi:hypothetical protein
MNSWLEIEEFSTLVNLDISAIQALIEEGKLISKEEDGQCFVEVSQKRIFVKNTTKCSKNVII